jgi:hypothetical protein
MNQRNARKRKKESPIINQKLKSMKTSEKSSKTSRALKAYGDEIKSNFKKQCDECTANRKDADEFRESKHSEELSELNAENKHLKKHLDEKSEEYRKNTSSNFRQTKYFKRYWIIIICLTLSIGSIITQSVYHYQHYRKMKIYNSVLMHLHDRNPKANIKQVIRVIERSEIDPQWHKEIHEQIKKYDDLWWLKD